MIQQLQGVKITSKNIAKKVKSGEYLYVIWFNTRILSALEKSYE